MLTELGEIDAALATAVTGLEEAERQGLPYEAALLRLKRGELMRRTGREADEADLERAKATLRDLGDRCERGPVHNQYPIPVRPHAHGGGYLSVDQRGYGLGRETIACMGWSITARGNGPGRS